MADDAARDISQAKRQKVARARSNNVIGLTDRRVAIETRTARLKLAAAVVAAGERAQQASGMGLIGRLSNPSVRAMVHELSEISH